jgi:two-component system heavy metal sensor histidine kinase CusS
VVTRTDIRLSIAARLALLFGGVAMLGFVLIALVLHLVMKHELERHQLEQIQSRMEEMRYMMEHARAPGIAGRVKEKLDAISPSDGRARYWMWSDDAEFRYGLQLERVMGETAGKNGVLEVELEGRSMRALRLGLPASDRRPAVSLVVGVDTRPFNKTAHSFEIALEIITFLGTLIVSALGYWVAKLGLAPVMQLSRAVHRIGPNNRSERLDLLFLPLELAQLGRSFNAALDRLEEAYHQLETFNDDVAHELRTPLANLIGQTQVALTRERNASELLELLQSNLEELDRLRMIVADMLFLARADQGERAYRLVSASIAAEIGKTIEFMEPLLDEAGLKVNIVGDATIAIETSLFRRALTNLIQNAIQYAIPSSTIVAQVTQRDDLVQVAISNKGEQIAEAHLGHIFDRFYRADGSRTQYPEHSGHGLGLAIVKAVATMHEGDVFAYSENGLTTIGLTLARRPVQ